jgi:hypothetical protein
VNSVSRIESLISPEYAAMQRELHGRPKGYGGKGKKWADTVVALARRYGCGSMLDYGAGQSSLTLELAQRTGLNLRLADYDPGVPGKENFPSFADLVVCTDVLEHIEPDRLDAVLEHIHALARKAVFLVVALDEANKVLSDGRNAHLILESPEWWEARVVGAGFRLDPLGELPLPIAYGDPAKRSKRWIAVAVPC